MEQLEKKLFHKKSVKNNLVLGYFSLLTKKSFSDITVSELVKESNVSRVSFYRNFSSLDGVIDYGIAVFQETIVQDVLPVFLTDRFSAWKKLIEKIFLNIKLYDDILTCIPQQNIEYLSDKLSKQLNLHQSGNDNNLNKKYLPIVNISTVLSVAKVWIKSNCKESVEEISDFTYKIISRNLCEIK